MKDEQPSQKLLQVPKSQQQSQTNQKQPDIDVVSNHSRVSR